MRDWQPTEERNNLIQKKELARLGFDSSTLGAVVKSLINKPTGQRRPTFTFSFYNFLVVNFLRVLSKEIIEVELSAEKSTVGPAMVAERTQTLVIQTLVG